MSKPNHTNPYAIDPFAEHNQPYDSVIPPPAPPPPQQSTFYDSNTGAYGQSNQPYVPPPGTTQSQWGPAPQYAAAPPPPPGTQPQHPPAPPQQQQQHTPVAPTSKFWTLGFYQQFFDVDTRQVMLRISNTLMPITSPDFLVDLGWHYSSQAVEQGVPPTQQERGGAQDNMFYHDNGVLLNRSPDLYGPFWITTTLWMLTGIVGNLLSKISTERDNIRKRAKNPDAEITTWHYDFTVVSVACTTVYVYCVGLSLLLFGIMKWKDLPVSLSHILCLYGYSMFIFLLTAILCAAPLAGFQWLFCGLGYLWSTAYLLLNFWLVWKKSLEKRWFIAVVLGVALAHLGLAMAFKFYFFNYAL